MSLSVRTAPESATSTSREARLTFGPKMSPKRETTPPHTSEARTGSIPSMFRSAWTIPVETSAPVTRSSAM